MARKKIVSMQIRASEDLRDRAKEIAKKQGLTLSELVLKLLGTINDKELKSVTLFSEKDFDWKIDGPNSTKMIVYDSNENPQKYGYHASGRHYTGIIGNDGKQIVIEEDIVLCAINDIDQNRELPLVKSTLNNLLSKSKEALDNKKGIYLNMNEYNYLS